jgi:hypothetical protein
VAPELPPPPYTWLITTSGEAALAGLADSATAAAVTTIVRAAADLVRGVMGSVSSSDG